MHLKEVVNLHWTLRKGIKIGEKNMCLRTTDFSTRASSATTVRFSSVQWRTISREFVPRSNPLTFEEAKTSGGLESVHGGIKRQGGTRSLVFFFPDRIGKCAIETFGKIAKQLDLKLGRVNKRDSIRVFSLRFVDGNEDIF